MNSAPRRSYVILCIAELSVAPTFVCKVVIVDSDIIHTSIDLIGAIHINHVCKHIAHLFSIVSVKPMLKNPIIIANNGLVVSKVYAIFECFIKLLGIAFLIRIIFIEIQEKRRIRFRSCRRGRRGPGWLP